MTDDAEKKRHVQVAESLVCDIERVSRTDAEAILRRDWQGGVRDVVIHRAGSIGDRRVTPLRIIAAEEAPQFNALEEYAAFYEREGAMLADAILTHLPGGVVDQLLAALLLKRASLLRVPL